MPTYKVLAQSAPSAATPSTLYTASNAVIVSTLNVSNTGGAADTIRIAVRPAGATLANQHYLVSASAALAFNAQTGTTYTFVLADADNKLVTASNAAAQTYSIPTNATTAFPIGTQINLIQIGAGQVTVQAATSGTTTVVSTGATPATPKCRAQYSAITLIKRDTDSWYAVGDIA